MCLIDKILENEKKESFVQSNEIQNHLLEVTMEAWACKRSNFINRIPKSKNDEQCKLKQFSTEIRNLKLFGFPQNY